MRRVIIGMATFAAFLPLVLNAQISNCISISKNLSFSSRGSEVVRLQNFLIGQSLLAAGNNTGYFGKLTQTAVQSYQRSKAIVSSGTPATTGYGAVGPKTRAAIARQCAATATTESARSSPPDLTPYSRPAIPADTSTSIPTCSPLAPQTQTLSCPSGQTGSITQTRTSTCPGPTWSLWTTTANTCTTPPPTTFSMANYWPQPAKGTTFIREYKRLNYPGYPDTARLVQRVTNVQKGSYDNYFLLGDSDWRGGPLNWADTWNYIVNAQGAVIELADQGLFGGVTYDSIYDSGNEIQWGTTMKVGDVVEGALNMHSYVVNTTTGAYTAAVPPTRTGWNTLKLVELIPQFTVRSHTFSNVLKFQLEQGFCLAAPCDKNHPVEPKDNPTTGWIHYLINYWMAPGVGFVQLENINTVPANEIDALDAYCSVSEDHTLCP